MTERSISRHFVSLLDSGYTCNHPGSGARAEPSRLRRYDSRVLGFSLLFVLSLAVIGTPSARAQSDSQPPTIIGRSPSPGVNGQAVNVKVRATFSEPIQQASVAFVLRDSANVSVPASLSYDASTQTVTLAPSADLIGSRTYTATVSGAMDLAGNTMTSPVIWSFSTGQPGFQESVVFSGLASPTAFQFASDGRVFVAQKNGIILVFDSLTATSPTVFADLQSNVDSSGNGGLRGMALDPAFPAKPYVYVLYTHNGTVSGGRLSRLQANGNMMTGVEQVLVEDWYQRYPDQPVGNLAFGPDGSLYASGGDGASSAFVDIGQTDSPSPDPLNEGGALRSQDLRTPSDPVTLDGSVIRVQPDTGQPVRETTSMAVGTPTVDANGVKSYPVTSQFQGSQPLIVRVLEPTNPAPGRPRRLLYVLPVEAGVTNQGSQFGDGLEELRLLDVPNRFNMTLIAPSFGYEPWYGDHATDQTKWMETFIVRELVPWGDSFLPAGATPQRFLIGFSKSGNGVLFSIFRHPNIFSAAAAWDSPAQLNDITTFPGLPLNFGSQTNYNLYFVPALVAGDAHPFTSSNRLWISGDQSVWTADMDQLHSQLTAAGIPHTWVAGGDRVHSWSSGWLDGAIAALDANASQIAPLDPNEPRIVAYGLRSPRLTMRPGTQEIWVADRGWNNSEQINRIPNSIDGIVENFGWPCYEGSATTAYSGSSICSSIYSQTAQTTAPYFSYLHQQKVVPGDETGVGSGAISGLAFYGSGSYPASYQGALFFSDYLRNNIWVIFKGSNGLPDPTNKADFLLGAASPVDLETGPGGDLFYADLNGGTIRRIRFVEPIGRSGGQPSGILPAGTTQAVVSLVTDQNATCRYAPTAGVGYGSMPNTFATTGGTVHSSTVTGLVSGGSYNFFVRCENAGGAVNPDDYPISFSIGQPPAITSASSTTLTVLIPGSFLVTASGTPTPSLSETGALPSGVTFKDNGNATATLSGLPASGTAGSYSITITASNGGTPANQSFTLTVSNGGGGSSNLAYVSGSVTGVVDFGGDSGSTLSIALHQNPGAGHLLVCAATWQSSTASASMSDLNNGAWTAIGFAKAGVGSVTGYRGQMFYVPAAVNAPTTVTLTIGSAVGFRAFECAEYSYTGTIATLDGTAQYSTTPASGGVATVSGLTTSHSNDLVFADCLGVDTSCTTGAGYTGLDDTNTSFKDRGQIGQSFLSGTGQLIEYKVGAAPGAQSATFGTGTNSDNVILGLVAFTANNEPTPPAITSAASTTFMVGAAGIFTVTATGAPTPSLTKTGALPSGVTFVDNGNGTATLAGTPASGTAGSYIFTITASNGVGTAANQSLTLTVTQPVDTTPPVRSNGQPTGVLPAGTSQTGLSLATNENATCRYALTAGVAYGSMPNTFSSTGGTAQATTVSGLADGGSYSYYVRCQDGTGNANPDDFVITFSVGGGSTVASSFSGTESPLSENGRWDSPGSWTDLQKDNGAYAVGASGLAAQARLVTPPMGADQYSEITYSEDPGSSSWVGVTTRVQGGGNGSCYLAIVYAGEVRFYRTDDAGSLNFTLLASASTDNGVAPRRLRLESQGTNHRVYLNGIQVISYNASGTLYANGQPGVAVGLLSSGSSVKILSFAGGAIGAADTTPPFRSNGQPAGPLTGGTTQTTLSLTTDENATCRYATTAGVGYGSMPNSFSSTGGTAHSSTVSGLVNGGSYNYYVRCQDTATNANPDDFTIGFTVAQPVDTTPPVRTNGAPSGTLVAGTTQATLSLTTDENATCRYASSAGVAYAAMPNLFAATGTTAHSTPVTGLVNGGSYNYYVRCQDTAGNPNTSDLTITFTVAQPVDTTPPVRSNGQPTGVLPAGTSQTGLSLATNENATCRYALTAGVAYGSMPNTFSSTGGTAQATTVSGLADGGSYSYYVRCQDGTGNANPDDFVITFSVGGGSTVASSFSGTESPLSENGRWDSPGSWTDLQKDNGAYAVGASGLAAQARLVTPPMGADQYSEITYSEDPGSSSWVGVTTRVQGGGNGSCYLAIVYAGEVRFYRTDDAGSLNFTLLASASTDNGVAPRRLRLESQGTNHRVYLNGIQVISYNASGTLYANGQPGVAVGLLSSGSSVKILSFAGGAIACG